MSAYGTAALCALSAALGAAVATGVGLARGSAETGQRVAFLQDMVAGNAERLDKVAREVARLPAAPDGARVACPPPAASEHDGGVAAPPAREADAAPDDTLSPAHQELVAEAEQVFDRAARQRFWGEQERDDFKRIVPQLPGPIAQGFMVRAMRGLRHDFPPRTHGPPL